MIFISGDSLSSWQLVEQWLRGMDEEDLGGMKDWLQKHFERYELDHVCTREQMLQLGREEWLWIGRGHSSGSSAHCLESFDRKLFRGRISVKPFPRAGLPNSRKSEEGAGIYRIPRCVLDSLKQRGLGHPFPEPDRPEIVYFDRRTGSLAAFYEDLSSAFTLDSLSGDCRPYVRTASAQAAVHTVSSWLKPQNRLPFVVVGPDGCGKEELLKYCFEQDTESQLTVVHCTAQSGATSVLQALQLYCVQVLCPIPFTFFWFR